MMPLNSLKAVLRPISVRTLLKRCATSDTSYTSRQSRTVIDDEDDRNKPIKYSTSKAATWPANGIRNDKPALQPLIISLSLGIFLLYFCVLREENDIDESLVSMSPEMKEFFMGIKKEQEKHQLKYLNKTT
ncbi:uncharacterized protein LOC144469478 [Augochlora pura]